MRQHLIMPSYMSTAVHYYNQVMAGAHIRLLHATQSSPRSTSCLCCKGVLGFWKSLIAISCLCKIAGLWKQSRHGAGRLNRLKSTAPQWGVCECAMTKACHWNLFLVRLVLVTVTPYLHENLRALPSIFEVISFAQSSTTVSFSSEMPGCLATNELYPQSSAAVITSTRHDSPAEVWVIDVA